MILLGSLLVILIIGVIFLTESDGIVYEISVIFSTALLGMGLILFPITRVAINSQIVGFKEIRATVERARAKGENIENAALQQKIVTINARIASLQYLNGTLLDIWIPDEVMKLKVIE